MTHPSTHQLERNIRLYPWYMALFNAFFWMPVFFLYFGEHLSLARVLQLEGIYYAAVVLLEVPSGYLSDRLGRKKTLLASSSLLLIAYGVFFLGSSFAAFALAQILLAAGIAFNSGTDTSFHYDSLAAVGRQEEYGAREAIAARSALLATSLAAFLGGGLSLIGLRWAYALSAVAALGTLAIVLSFREPAHETDAPTARFFRQIFNCFAYLKQPTLAWLFGFAVLSVIISHIPYEFIQPYLDLMSATVSQAAHTPLVAGAHMAVATLLGAWAAGRSTQVAARIGTRKTLLLAGLLQLIIIIAMASLLHAAVVALILLRDVSEGLFRAPLNAAVTPHIARAERATYLSLQSLVGRLGFAGLLIGLSLIFGGVEVPDWATLSQMLLICAMVSGVGLVVLASTSRRLRA